MTKLSFYAGAGYTDDTLTMLVYTQAVLAILSGALVIANVRFGGLLLALCTMTMVITRDNPILTSNDQAWRASFQNMLKDLAVAGVGILIFIRKQAVIHRRDGKVHIH